MSRIKFILLPVLFGLTAVSWLFDSVPTKAQSEYTISGFTYMAENGYTHTSGLYYTDTGTIGVTSLSLADIQDSISTTENTILNTGVYINFVGDYNYTGPQWWVKVIYTDTTSQILYPVFGAGVLAESTHYIREYLSGGKSIQSIDLYTDLTGGQSTYRYVSLFVTIPAANIGGTPTPITTPTPVGIPTPDPVITYGWGGVVPTPISYVTDTLTTTLSMTYFWDIDNYEYALSVSRTVWTLPWLPQAFAILAFFAAVMLGFTLLMRILKARSTAATQATVLAQQPFEQRNEAEIRDELLRQELQGIRSDLRRQAATGLSRSFYRNVRGRGGFGKGL